MYVDKDSSRRVLGIFVSLKQHGSCFSIILTVGFTLDQRQINPIGQPNGGFRGSR